MQVSFPLTNTTPALIRLEEDKILEGSEDRE